MSKIFFFMNIHEQKITTDSTKFIFDKALPKVPIAPPPNTDSNWVWSVRMVDS